MARGDNWDKTIVIFMYCCEQCKLAKNTPPITSIKTLSLFGRVAAFLNIPQYNVKYLLTVGSN